MTISGSTIIFDSGVAACGVTALGDEATASCTSMRVAFRRTSDMNAPAPGYPRDRGCGGAFWCACACQRHRHCQALQAGQPRRAAGLPAKTAAADRQTAAGRPQAEETADETGAGAGATQPPDHCAVMITPPFGIPSREQEAHRLCLGSGETQRFRSPLSLLGVSLVF